MCIRSDKATGKIITDRKMISKEDKTFEIKLVDDATADTFSKDTYKTLLTRGQKGGYIYCDYKALRE